MPDIPFSFQLIIIVILIMITYEPWKKWIKRLQRSSIPSDKNYVNVSQPIALSREHKYVRCRVGGKFDANLSVARFENGVVYCHPNNGSDFIIGYYDEEQVGSITVRCVSDKQMIGSISTGNRDITLSRLGLISRFEKMGFPRKAPDRIEWTCAELFSNCILASRDSGGQDCIALCEVDDIGSAAAFICLHYETIGTGIYHDFFYNWLS